MLKPVNACHMTIKTDIKEFVKYFYHPSRQGRLEEQLEMLPGIEQEQRSQQSTSQYCCQDSETLTQQGSDVPQTLFLRYNTQESMPDPS